MFSMLNLFSGIGDLKIKDLRPIFTTSAEVVMKASGLRLEAIRVIAREQGVEIEDTACRCIDESLLAELAEAHVRRLKAYFYNAKRHVAELAGDELATFVDFCNEFKRRQNIESSTLSWSDIDTEAIKEHFWNKVHQLTSSEKHTCLFGSDFLYEIADLSQSNTPAKRRSKVENWFYGQQSNDIIDRIQRSWLYYEKPSDSHTICEDYRLEVRKVTLSGRYHIFPSEEEHHIAC